MAEYIEDPVLTRSDLLLELFISRVRGPYQSG
jgi:hypothetical protein